MEDICKVCRLGRFDDRPLFHPCRCTGSIKYVHQDCLMQWLRHSGKEYCELCHHKFQFASVYRHDMPNWIPFSDIYQSTVKNSLSKFGRWFQFGFVIFMWLFLVPVVTYRIYKCMIYSSIWSLILLPVKIFTIENIVLDSIFGLVIVVVSLLGFISLVWLKDQLSNGENPNWLIVDLENAKKVDLEEENRRMNLRNETISMAASFSRRNQNSHERQTLNRDMKFLEAKIDLNLLVVQDHALQWNFDKLALLRVEEMILIYDLGLSNVQYQPLLRIARLKYIDGVENWKKGILDQLRGEGKIPPNIAGLPTPAAIVIKNTPLPSLKQLGLTTEESKAFMLFNRLPCPPVNDRERQEMTDKLYQIQTSLKNLAKNCLAHQQMFTRTLMSNDLDESSDASVKQLREDCDLLSETFEREVTMISSANMEVRERHPEAFQREGGWYERLLGQNIAQEELERRPERQQQQEVQQNQHQEEQRQRIRRPNIGQALVGLAREPQDANAEAIQADQLMRMVGLDGSFRFIEHVIWLTVLVSIIIFTFVYIPFIFGSSVAWAISLWKKIGIVNWQTLSSVLFGYCLIMSSVVFVYYVASAVSIHRLKPILGIIYLALKICLLLLLEAGIFPLLCGWWIDICAFGLLGSNLKIRESSLNSAPGTIMFLHWLAGMIFVFYFASLVVLLREIIRPGVLWFLRNLNDQNFHPIQDMISQPFQRHMRRFFMSNIMFGVSIMLVILIPSHIVINFLPGFLPYNLTLISSVSPIREIQLELILLQFVIPTLLEHSNTRMAMKRFVKYWSTVAANALALQSYLLDNPQSGGDVVDIHGITITHIEYNPMWDAPVYIGENQTLGPGYAPFKPYLRPKYFGIRITMFIIILITTVISVSAFLMVIPILTGRYLMLFIGIESPPDVYTSSIGIYVLWIFGRAISPLLSGCSRGDINALVNHLITWIKQGLKCIIAAVLLFVVIPLMLGHFVNLLIISPLRVPVQKTPLFYLTTEWALGLLHMKCVCGIVWLTDTSFKRILDVMYQNGARNLRISFIVKEIVSPVVCNLVLCLSIPYVVLMGIVKHLGLLSPTTCYAVYRYCYPAVLVFLITLVIILVIVKQFHNLYTGIKNEKYLIGRQLMNFGSAPTSEISTLSIPVEETREQ